MQACSTFAAGTCEPTWSDVQTDTTLCAWNRGQPGLRYYVSDCDGYHVLHGVAIDSGSTFYYDGASGALVAIVNDTNRQDTCPFGPWGGFVQPDCSAVDYRSPPPQCVPDAGPADSSPD